MNYSFLKDYDKIEKLGSGSQGECFLIKHKKSGELRVLKEIKLKNLKETEKNYIENEIKIMKRIKHPSIIQYINSYKSKKYIYILMEYAKNGSLENIISKKKNYKKKNCEMKIKKKKSKKKICEKQLKKWFYQISLGLLELHSKKIIHRDIKSSNILLDHNNNIKISDFGVSKFYNKSKTFIGTPYYISPEIINGLEYDYKTDIWSLGVLLYELANFEFPFKAKNIFFLAYKILKGEYLPMKGYSKTFLKLVDLMLEVNPVKRIGVKKILENSYFKVYFDKEKINQKEIQKKNNNFFSNLGLEKKNSLKENNFIGDLKKKNSLEENFENKINNINSVNEFDDLINLCTKIDRKRGFFEENENSDLEDSYSDFEFIDLKELNFDLEKIKKKEKRIKKKIGEKTFNQITKTFCINFDDEKFINKIYDNEDYENVDFGLSVSYLNEETKNIADIYLKKKILFESGKIFF